MNRCRLSAIFFAVSVFISSFKSSSLTRCKIHYIFLLDYAMAYADGLLMFTFKNGSTFEG